MSAATSDVILTRMMSLHPKIIDLTLDRVWMLLERLGNPHLDLPPVIHIAGTNGKGSTQAMLRAGLEATGGRVHAYTSPHLVRFHERIRLAGDLISEPDLTAYLDECERVNGGTPITYFEITTVAAILAFARTSADWTLLEVGLGGRLDATNVVDRPVACVITPVSLDHQQFLGDTVAQIAAEKAGIVKRGVPCIVGPQTDEGLEVIEATAARTGAPLLIHGQHWHVWEERGRLIYQDETGLVDLPLPILPGPHQILNAGAVIATLRALDQPAPALDAAMENARWPARMQRLQKGPLVTAAQTAELWLDGGHNPAAGEAMAAMLARLTPRPTWLICGMLATKDPLGYLRPLADLIEGIHTVTIPGESAAMPAHELAEAAITAGLTPVQTEDMATTIRQIVAAQPNARIMICGSLYLAGAVLAEND